MCVFKNASNATEMLQEAVTAGFCITLAASRLLFRPGQLEVGSMLKQSKMAQTLTKLASDARQDYFYQKEFATEWHRELSDIGKLYMYARTNYAE